MKKISYNCIFVWSLPKILLNWYSKTLRAVFRRKDTNVAILKVKKPPVMKHFTGHNYPLIYGLLIGAAGGTIGTLIYNAIKESSLWQKLSFIFDYALIILNISYKTPMVLVVVIMLFFMALLFFYYFKTTKSWTAHDLRSNSVMLR